MEGLREGRVGQAKPNRVKSPNRVASHCKPKC